MNWIEGFVHDCQARGLTPHTIESYRSNVKSFLQHCKNPCTVEIEDLKDFLGYLRSRGLQGTTLKEYFASVSTFYDYLVIEGKLQSNPVVTFRKRYLRIKQQHGGNNTRQLISIDQMRGLITLAQRDLLARTMILFLAKTGLRRGELLAMDIQDINLEKNGIPGEAKSKAQQQVRIL